MKDDVRRQFEQLGTETVRQMLANGRLPGHLRGDAASWLVERDAEERAATDASQSEHLRLAKAANDAASRAAAAAERQALAAERANTRATIALVIATASIIITVVESIIRLLLQG